MLERLIPVTETLFATFNLGYMVVIAAAGVLAVLALHPRRGAITLSGEATRQKAASGYRSGGGIFARYRLSELGFLPGRLGLVRAVCLPP